jgi:hypothetical protein
MLTSYQINDQEGLYYLTFQLAVIEYWFAVENSVIGSRRLPFRSVEVKKTSPSGVVAICDHQFTNSNF